MQKAEIRAKIEQSGLKKTFIAQKIGMGRQNFEYYIKGEGEIDHDIGAKILDILRGNKSHSDTIQTISNNTGNGSNSNISGTNISINNGELNWLKEKADMLNQIIQLAEENKQLREKLNECETRNQSKQGEKPK